MASETSELFDDVFLGCCGGTPRAECSCGRIVYSDSPYIEDGERERLDAEAVADPDRFVYQQYDAVSIVEFCGIPFVLGCPCKRLVWAERHLWHYREQIAKYLRKRAEATAADAGKTLGVLLGEKGGE